MALSGSVSLAQHPDEHRSERPVLLAVDRNSVRLPLDLG